MWRATGGIITPAAEVTIAADVVDTAGVMAARVIMLWMAVIEDLEVAEMAVTLVVVAEVTAVVAILTAVIVVVIVAVMEEAVEGIIMAVDIIMVAEGEATTTAVS